jgi:putative flavoprotein involved in K+ transport
VATEVTALERNPGPGRRFRLTTTRGPIEADEVIVATGAFQVPRIPAAGAAFPSSITQVHSHHYRNEAQLPPGGVLVIGSGQTGVQLAEELHEAGREVFLSVGQCGRAPRRYRGRDSFWWLRQVAVRGPEVGAALPTVRELPDPRLKFAGNPHLSGHGGGHDTNLRRMAADGIRLAGRFTGVDGTRVTFASDLAANLQFADGFFDARFRPIIDAFIEGAGIDAPADDRAWPAYTPPEVGELDLIRDGITSVLWTTGYAADFSWLRFPILDESGLPRHDRGVSDVAGLTFIGLLWQHTVASANLVGVALDAAYLASRW